MIKPFRLIIGSWILVPMPDNNYRWAQVTSIGIEELCVDSLVEGEYIQYSYRQIKPIALSGTILEKFGFTIDKGSIWYHEIHPIAIKRSGPEEWEFPYWPLLGANYLHELQIIFSFLTGETMEPYNPE